MYIYQVSITLYASLIAFLIGSVFIQHKNLNKITMTLCVFLLIKWLTDYRKCTLSYVECKIRGVKKESGWIYQLMENIYDINKIPLRYHIYMIVCCVLFINMVHTEML